jgi:tetratricopeptide (TPR) repeat protein
MSLCAGLLVVLSGIVAWHGRSQKHLIFGWLWFLVALLPVIGLIQVGGQAYADRYAYIPHIGLLVAIVWELHRLLQRGSFGRTIGTGLALAATGACAVLTCLQVQTWRDSNTLWTRVITLDRYHPVANLRLGRLAYQRQDWDAAQDYFSNVLVYRPPAAQAAILALGMIHQQRQEWNRAAEYYRWLLRLNPGNQMALEQLRKVPADRAVAPRRSSAAVAEKTKIALTLMKRGQTAEAAGLLQEAANNDPLDASAQLNAARALDDFNRSGAARQYYARVLQIDPDNMEAQHGLDRNGKLQALP